MSRRHDLELGPLARLRGSSAPNTALAALCLLLCACVGNLDGGPRLPGWDDPDRDDVVPDVPCTGTCVERSRMSRITASEYAFGVLDVLGVAADTSALPGDGAVAHFDSNEFVEPSETDADRYELVATAVAERFVASEAFGAALAATPACTSRDAACATELAARWGAQLYRRDLTADELAAYSALYVWATEPATDAELTAGLGGSFEDGVRLVVTALLQSPRFLFFVETGAETATPGVVALTPHEVAARLARLFWQSVPDATLLEAARRGQLSSPDEIEHQARRLLADPRSERMWLGFAHQWLEVDRLASVPVGTPPEGETWDANVVSALVDDLDSVVMHVLGEGDARLQTLLTVEGGTLSDPRAGWVLGVEQTGWNERVPQRHGLLTLPAVLAANGRPSFSRPHWRGLFVRDRMLCQVVPPPDPALAASIVALRSQEEEHPSAVTTRERLDAMTGSEPCASCHRLTNPIGYGLDRFDGFGRAREVEVGIDGASHALDTSGEIASSRGIRTDIDGAFADTDELLDLLASSETVARCTTLHLARFALRRDASSRDDAPSVDAAYATMSGSGGDLRETIVALVRSDAFRHRRLTDAP